MTLVQHIPAFIDTTLPARTGEFETLEELHNLPWVRAWTDAPGFYRLSLADRNTLVIERDGGRWWWVLGFIRNGDPASLGLPKWEPVREK